MVNNGDLKTVSSSYLKDMLHVTIVDKAMLPPLRISGVTVNKLFHTVRDVSNWLE